MANIFDALFNIVTKKDEPKSTKKKPTKKSYINKSSTKNYKSTHIKQTEKKKIMENTISTSQLAKHFNIKTKDLTQILINLDWIEQSGKWTILLRAGEQNGGKQEYNARTKQKYILWNEDTKNNFELKIEIKKLQKITEQKKPKKITKQEKLEKGARYEAYVAEFFRKQGCYVWEHGKEKGVKDSNIDLFVKKEKCIYFIQCKDWATWKIDHNKVKATRMDISEYLETNKNLKSLLENGYAYKILYVTSKECLTKGAYTYIKEHSDIVDYQVIPIEE